MSLSRKSLSLMKKDDINESSTPNKRTRINDTNNEITQAREKENFIKMCKQVSYKAFQDFKKRFQLLDLPGCENVCTHEFKKIISAAEGCFKIDLNSSSWCDALEVCIMCIMSGQCLTGSIMKNIGEIIMNAHEDAMSGHTVDYILKQCQYTLLLQFTTHPPCYESSFRDCYKEFLLTAMDEKNENTFSNRKNYSSDKGIIVHCFDRLMYEISKDSKDGILIDKNNLNEVSDGIRGLYWKKENLEIFEVLERTDRIERLMMVLESTIHLLQTDLALSHRGYHHSSKKSNKRFQKPIIACLLWPDISYIGTVSHLCNQIMELFAYFIHLQYPDEHITTMSLWMNVIVEMLYVYAHNSKSDYPDPPHLCIRFAQKFCHIITSLPSESRLRILERIQPTFMRYLVGEEYIKLLPHTPHKDIINIIKSCVEDSLWKEYPGEITNGKIKLRRLLKIQSKKCNNCKTSNNKNLAKFTTESTNPYPKLELDVEISDNEIQRSFFVNVIFITLIAYLETYNIRDFRHRLQALNTDDKNDCDSELPDYSITPEFVKKYTYIIGALNMLFQLLNGKKDTFSLNLREILKKYLT